MKLHFEEESLSKKQECSALTSNLEVTALNCVMAKRANERDSARKIFASEYLASAVSEKGDDTEHQQPHHEEALSGAELFRLWSTRAPGYGEVRKEASKR